MGKKADSLSKVEYAINLLGDEHSEFDNFIIAIIYLHERGKGFMTQANFCRFLVDYEKTMIEYKDKEAISFTKYKSILASSLQKYCKAESLDFLVKLAIFASACYNLEDLLAFCKLPPRYDDYDMPF